MRLKDQERRRSSSATPDLAAAAPRSQARAGRSVGRVVVTADVAVLSLTLGAGRGPRPAPTTAAGAPRQRSRSRSHSFLAVEGALSLLTNHPHSLHPTWLTRVGARYPGGCLLMALSGRDLLLPLYGHLDGTSGGAGLKAALCTGKPKAALFPTSADHGSLTSKPKAEALVESSRG